MILISYYHTGNSAASASQRENNPTQRKGGRSVMTISLSLLFDCDTTE